MKLKVDHGILIFNFNESKIYKHLVKCSKINVSIWANEITIYKR